MCILKEATAALLPHKCLVYTIRFYLCLLPLQATSLAGGEGEGGTIQLEDTSTQQRPNDVSSTLHV